MSSNAVGSKLFCEFIYCACGCGKTRPKYSIQKSRLRKRNGKYYFEKERLRIDRSIQYIKSHSYKREKGPKHWNWKGGKLIAKDGYVYVYSPDHPNKDRHGYVREHRLIMEKHLGRYLTKNEVVHHKDGNTKNNDISNLELIDNQSSHAKNHIQEHRESILSKRNCVICNSSKTYLVKSEGYYQYQWYFLNHDKSKPLCGKCYQRINKK